MAQHARRLERLAAAGRGAEQLQLDKIVVLRGAAFHGSERGGPLAHLLERFFDIFVGDLHLLDFDVETLVIAELELGKHFKDGAELQRAALRIIHLVHLRLGDRRQLLLRDGLLDPLRHKGLHHLAFDVLRKAPADKRYWRLARTEARNAGDARKIAGDLFGRLLHFFGGNLQLEFAPAACPGRRQSR